jgi:hypothetical protein
MGDDEDIEPRPPDDESDASVAGLEAAIAAWDAQAPRPANPYAEETGDHRDWDQAFHEYYEYNV